jgi:molybdopterin-guanine dinucleotide biosynthesis protein A
MRPADPDPGTRGAVQGVVLAGGRSRRFGRDKLVEGYEGRPLLHHPVLRLLEVCDRVIVVLAPAGEEPPALPDERVRFVRDEREDQGPLRGLAAGLASAGSGAVLVAGGDMPDMQPPVLRQMLRALRETRSAAIALSDRGDARPLPLALDVARTTAVVDELLLGGTRSLRDLLAAVETAVVDEPTWTALDPDRRTLVDIDEPEDLGR